MLVASCRQQPVTAASKVFNSEPEKLSFRYPSNWEPVPAQAKSTIVLLYARDGSLATCNVSVVSSDRESARDFDAAYFTTILSQIHSDIRIKKAWHRDILGQAMALVECDFTMAMAERTVPMGSLMMATVRERKRYMMILNAPRDRLPELHDDFEIMVSTFLLAGTTKN